MINEFGIVTFAAVRRSSAPKKKEMVPKGEIAMWGVCVGPGHVSGVSGLKRLLHFECVTTIAYMYKFAGVANISFVIVGTGAAITNVHHKY